MNDTEALDLIARHMTAQEWNADTLDAIARAVIDSGRIISDPNEDATARIERVSSYPRRATFDNPAEMGEARIWCDQADEQCDAYLNVSDPERGVCRGNTRHPEHEVTFTNASL